MASASGNSDKWAIYRTGVIFYLSRVDVSYVTMIDVTDKLHKYQLMCDTVHRTLRNERTGETKLKFCKVMSAPELTYGCETDAQRIKALK